MEARAEKAPKADISGVVNRLNSVSVAEAQAALSTAHGVNPEAGIIIANLSLAPEVCGGQDFHYHAARVLPGRDQNFVKPHYHLVGEEPYRMLSGEGGEMNLGRVRDKEVVWDSPKPVTAGEIVVVEEGQVHSLRNTGTDPFDFLFACPDAHIQTRGEEFPNGDRYFTMDLPNGIPLQYPK